jgi:hypothetical protein
MEATAFKAHGNKKEAGGKRDNGQEATEKAGLCRAP